jgi:hypothetical protein
MRNWRQKPVVWIFLATIAFSIVSISLQLSTQLKSPVEMDWGFQPEKSDPITIPDEKNAGQAVIQRGPTIKVEQQGDDDSYANPALGAKANKNPHPHPPSGWQDRFANYRKTSLDLKSRLEAAAGLDKKSDFNSRMKAIQQLHGQKNSTLHYPQTVHKPSAYRRPNKNMTFSRIGRNKVIYFLHIHKAAGSSMCHMAFRNRLSVHRQRNCNVQVDQQCCGNEDTMTAQVLFAQHTYLDLVAVEWVMYDNMAPEWYDYAVILRNSRTRYYSHWNHASTKKDRGAFPEWWSRQPDNWNTRMVCGPKCATASKFQITPQLFNYTLNRLALFTDILFVETMNASVSKFSQKHNWLDVPPNVVNRKNKPGVNVTHLSAIGWDPDMSALDDALYEFGQRKEAGLLPYAQYSDVVQRHLDAYFLSGVERNCTSPCCSEKCSGYR